MAREEVAEPGLLYRPGRGTGAGWSVGYPCPAGAGRPWLPSDPGRQDSGAARLRTAAAMNDPVATVGPVHRETMLASRDREVEGRAWLRALGGEGPEREQAIARLHALLLRAARFELIRRRSMLNGGGESIEDLAVQSADNALVALMGKLDQYRFKSRFTTWAYKFAILEAAVLSRRRAWQDRELPTDPQAWGQLTPVALDPA